MTELFPHEFPTTTPKTQPNQQSPTETQLKPQPSQPKEVNTIKPPNQPTPFSHRQSQVPPPPPPPREKKKNTSAPHLPPPAPRASRVEVRVLRSGVPGAGRGLRRAVLEVPWTRHTPRNERKTYLILSRGRLVSGVLLNPPLRRQKRPQPLMMALKARIRLLGGFLRNSSSGPNLIQ